MSASVPAPASHIVPPARTSRPYLYWLDPLRGVTALIVILVHVLIFVNFHWRSVRAQEWQSAGVAVTHVTRNVFMFITAITLVYVYAGKPLPLGRFWARRGLSVLLPYCLWTVAYAWINTPGPTVGHFARIVARDLITGGASYQLYFISITLQFYLLLPLFLRLLNRVSSHPLWTLAITFAIQFAIMYVDYHYLLTGRIHVSGWLATVLTYRQNYIVLYPFYFVMGGLMAVHLRRVQPALLRYGAWTFVALLVAMAVVLIQFVVSIRWLHKSLDYATAPIQPLVLVYSIAVILCMCWLAIRWEARREPGGIPPGYPAFKQLSDASFGVYLMHALVLRVVADHLLPALPAEVPGVLRVLIIWIVAAGGTAAISIALVHTPVLSRLVGRARPLPQWHRAERPRPTNA
jgi:surface polysaccharide O-acyltransferase-like enzyme